MKAPLVLMVEVPKLHRIQVCHDEHEFFALLNFALCRHNPESQRKLKEFDVVKIKDAKSSSLKLMAAYQQSLAQQLSSCTLAATNS